VDGIGVGEPVGTQVDGKGVGGRVGEEVGIGEGA